MSCAAYPLATVCDIVLLWMLFRPVPEDDAAGGAPGGSEAGATASAVEAMANEADPSWMKAADSASRIPSAPGTLVPPVFAPGGGSPAPARMEEGDDAAVATGTSEQGAAEPEDPRRSAFRGGDEVPAAPGTGILSGGRRRRRRR